MKLQLALDLLDENEALDVVKEVGKYFDIIEVGTSLLKLCGLSIVYKIKTICPDKIVFIDSKVIDGPEREATLMCASGADMFSMLACATDVSVKKVLQISRNKNVKVIFDMQSVNDYATRCKELKELDAEYLCVHKNSDCGESLTESFKEFLVIKELTGLPIAIAGGINLNSIAEIKKILNPEIAIIGGAVLKAKNREEIVVKFREIADK
jgi:3-hexulose-6-phosphate synthase